MIKEYNYSDEREFLRNLIQLGPTDLLQYIKKCVARMDRPQALIPY